MLNNNVNRVTKNLPPMVKNPPLKNPPPNKNIIPNNNPPPIKTNTPIKSNITSPPVKTNQPPPNTSPPIKSNTTPSPQFKNNTQPSPNIPTKTIPTKNTTPPTQNRVVTPPSKFKVGELVYAKWYEDTLFYMAKILTVESNRRYNLVFTEYGNEQVTEEADIGPIESEQSSSSSSSGSLDGKGGLVVLDGIEYSNPFHNSGPGYVQFVSNYKWSSRNFNQIHIDKNTAQKIKDSVTPKPKNNGPITAKVIYFLLDNNTLDDDESVTNWVNKEKSNVLAKATSCLQNGEEEKAFKLLFELLKAKIDKDELSWVLILIGKMYMEGLGTEQSAEKAMKVYEKSVAMGNAYAGFLLGNIYWFGDEVDLDVKKAIDYFTKSDIGESLFALAQIYGEGRNGVKKDPSKSIQLYQKACQKGNDNALHYLGTLYEEIDDLRNARKYHKKAAKNGNEKAMWNLANLYYEKAEKLQKDRKKSDKFYLKAFYLYEQLSDEGNQEAICYLAKMYQGNKGVAQDLKKAKDLYERGVEFDHERCMMYLGDMYDSGNGVQVDYKKACDLYQKAVNKGNKWAMGILADMYFFGKGVPLDKQKGAQLLHLAVGVINLK